MLRADDFKKLQPAARKHQEVGPVDFKTELSESIDAREFSDPIAQGRALIENFKPREAVAYDETLVNEMMAARKADVGELSSQLSDIVEGSGEMPGRSIEAMTTRYIWNMAQDLDATLSVSQAGAKKADYFANHALQLSVMGMALAAEMKMPEDEVRIAGISGLIHDLGMGKVPKELLDRPGPIGRGPFLEIAKHPITTLDMTERVLGIPNRCRLIVYQVHERNNGKGYPRQRTGNKTYLLAKVLGIVDAYLAMISDRPYRPAMLPYHALMAILDDTKAGLFDPKVTRAFLKLIGLFPVGSWVTFASGAIGRITRAGGDNFARPMVSVTHNAEGVPQEPAPLIDLAQETDPGWNILRAIPALVRYDDE